MESEKLARLSELTAIARQRELTFEEKRERESLRCEYRAAVTGSLRAQLERTTIIEPDGRVVKIGREGAKTGGKTSGEE